MSTKREPLLSDDDLIGVGCGVLHRDDIKKNRSIQHLFNAKYLGALQVRDHYEAARAKDAELIQSLLNALEGLVYLEFCNDEGLASGAPTSKDWKKAFDKAQEQIDVAAAQGFKPSEP